MTEQPLAGPDQTGAIGRQTRSDGVPGVSREFASAEISHRDLRNLLSRSIPGYAGNRLRKTTLAAGPGVHARTRRQRD